MNIFDMLGNPSARRSDEIFRFEQDEIIVDTCRVADSSKPWETGVYHPSYNDGQCIIVALYDTKEEAKAGHDKWVRIVTAEKLPAQIKDVSDCFWAQLARGVDGDMVFEKGKK